VLRRRPDIGAGGFYWEDDVGLFRSAVAAALVAAAVGATAVVGPGTPGAGAVPGPEVEEYGDFPREVGLNNIVRGPGGRMWFTIVATEWSPGSPINGNPRLASITASGTITEHPLPYVAQTLIAGAADTLWISSSAPPLGGGGTFPPRPTIAQISASGSVVAEHPLPDQGDGLPWGAITSLALGPDGNVWFTSLGQIGRLTPSGSFTGFAIPSGPEIGPTPTGLTVGTGGDLWWVDGRTRIGRVTTAGQITMYQLPGVPELRSIAPGPDGNMWAVERSIVSGEVVHSIVEIGASGSTTTSPVDLAGIGSDQIIAGPGGDMWIAGSGGTLRISAGGERTEFPAGRNHGLTHIAFDAQGRLWYTRSTVDGGKPAVGVMSAEPAPTGEFTALTPARVLDTRNGTGRGGSTAPLGPAAQIDVQITGRGGVPASGVSAVVLNATVTGATAGSYLRVWPTGQLEPAVSNLNYAPGQTVPNLVTVAVGDGGTVSVFNAVGSTHVIFDVLGFYSSSTGPFGARFVPLDPVRVVDTRDGTGGVPVRPVGPDQSLVHDLTGPGILPETGVSGVVMNVTVTEPTGNGFLTVHPDGVTRPLASNLNFVPGQTVPNLVTVRLSPDGALRFYNAVGSTHVVADLVGFYTDEVTTNAGRFVPVYPARLADTRVRGYPVGPEEAVAVWTSAVTGSRSADVDAVALNVTATEPTAAGYLTVYPPGCGGVPFTSSVNFSAGQTVPNHAISAVSVRDDVCAFEDGIVDVFNPVGEVHVIADMFGYFTGDGYVDHSSG
jgi:hypothetical protein